jgi:hypothetical protein
LRAADRLAHFDRAQQILTERREDPSLRRSNQSDYLLTGLLRCERCGKRHVGASAKGCAQRIEDLDRKLAGLRARREELAIDEHDAPAPLSEVDIRGLQAQVGDVVRNGDTRARKALPQALVHEIRMAGRDEIRPTFALPAVRPRAGSVPPGGIEPPLPA